MDRKVTRVGAVLAEPFHLLSRSGTLASTRQRVPKASILFIRGSLDRPFIEKPEENMSNTIEDTSATASPSDTASLRSSFDVLETPLTEVEVEEPPTETFPERPVKVIIVGAGIGGIANAVLLSRKVNNLSYTVYDRNDKVGGTWAENRYPGVRCMCLQKARH